MPSGIIAYSSGTNRACDIRGAAVARVPIGVDVSKLSETAIREILAIRAPVLLDSGAFGEVSVRDGNIVVTKPITDQEWNRRLDIYLRFARAQRKHRAHVSVIAPDQVGSQEQTLNRLRRFRAAVRRIKAAGAQVIVPMQTGRLSAADFYTKVTDLLGMPVVAALPMNKAACTLEEVIRFVQRTQVGRIHLLGIGMSNRRAEEVIRSLRAASPKIKISLDSNRIRAAVGQRRPITIREKKYAEEFQSEWSGEVDLRGWGGKAWDMTELLFSPSYWLPQVTTSKAFANALTWLTPADREQFAQNPDAFLRQHDADDWLTESLMVCYREFIHKRCRRAARSRAVAETLQSAVAQTAQHFGAETRVETKTAHL